MTAFVLDASVTVAWCFEDEATPESWALLDALENGTAFVPALWLMEVANILVCAERRGRITADKADGFFAMLRTLPIRVEPLEHGHALDAVRALARAERLTAYDAAYLELARRMKLPIATRDNDLCAAAQRQGVVLYPV